MTHDFTATYQEAIISEINGSLYKVKCTIPALEDLETPWLSIATSVSSDDKDYQMPTVGTLVSIILDSIGESGCVIGCIYNNKDKTPTDDPDIWIKRFANGTTFQHDKKSGDVTIHAAGAVYINNSPVVVNNGDITVNNANVDVKNGTLTVTGGDVIADGISLKSHLHSGVSSGNSKTGAPTT